MLVIDAETGTPVAGADVFLVDEQRARKIETEHRQALEPLMPKWGPEQREALLLWLAATRYRTDATGTVHVAAVGGNLVYAHAGASRGGGDVGPMPEGGWTIRVEAPRFVDVVVVDAHGKPAKGVKVELGTMSSIPSIPRLDSFARSITAEDGSARLARNGLTVPRVFLGKPLYVDAEVTGSDAPVRIPVDTAPAASRPPLRLHLPPTGQVRVLVYDATDRLCSGVQSVSLRRADGARAAWIPSSASRREPEGAWFDRVVLGARFEALVQVANQSGQLRVEQAGPTREGELVVFTVRMNAGDPIVKLRLMDAAGKPLAKQSVAAFLWNASGYEGRQVTTDADGGIEVVVPAKLVESDDARLVLYRRGPSQQWSEYRDGCSLALGAGFAGVVDRGEAQMREEPVLVSGVVLDAAGKPVPDVAVAAQMSFHQTGSGGWAGGGPGRWTDHRVRTDAQGRFELRESAPKPGALDLRIDTHRPEVHARFVAAPPSNTPTSVSILRPFAAVTLLVLFAPAHAQSSRPAAPVRGWFDVLVVDARGRPAAGVWPILVNVGQEPGRTWRRSLGSLPTDAEGRTRLCCQVPQPPEAERASLAVLVEILGAPRILAPVPPEGTDPQHPMRVQLPPTGQVRVLVYDENERLHRGLQRLLLTRVDASSSGGAPHAPTRPEPEGGWFDRVALGAEYEAYVEVDGLSGQLRVRQAGPTRDGELVVIPVRMTAAQPIVSLHVLDHDGTPVVGSTVWVRIRQAGQEASSQTILTRGGGSVRVVLPSGLRPDANVTAVVSRRGLSSLCSEYLGACVVDLGAGLTGFTDRGQARLSEEPVLLAGVVLDAERRPVAGVAVSCGRDPWSSSSRWTGHRVRSDAEGRFCLREIEPEARPLALHLDTDGWLLAEPVSAAPGTKDVELIATRPAELRVKLREGQTLSPGFELCLTARRRGADESSSAWLKGGEFGLRNLRPGTYDLEFGFGNGRACFAVDNVVLKPGQTCSDPRLLAADWTGSMRRIGIEVRGPVGKVVRFQGRTELETGSRWDGHGWTTDVYGRISILVPRSGSRVRIQGPEVVTHVANDPENGLVVRLFARPKVRVVLPEKVTLPEDGIFVRLLPREPAGAAFDGAWGKLTPGTDLVLLPDFTGRARIALVQSQPGVAAELWQGEIDVPTGDGVTDVTLPLDVATAARITEELRRNAEREPPRAHGSR